MFKPYLVYRLQLPSFPSHSQWTLAFGRQDERLSEPLAAVIASQVGVNVEPEEDKLL